MHENARMTREITIPMQYLVAMQINELVEKAKADGVTRREDLPFILQAPDGDAAVILVHGFTASPLEMRPLAEFLHGEGLTCLAVRLPGHATSPEDLAGRVWEEWLDCVAQAYAHLAGQHGRIYAVGMSTGCLVLLALALETHLSGLVLCSPYLKVRHRLAGQAWWLRHIRPFHPAPPTSTEGSGYYSKRPVAGIHQINRLVRYLNNKLAEIAVPVLAMNGEGDMTVDIESGRMLYEKLGGNPKVYLRFGPETPHVLTGKGNPHYRSVFELTAAFISTLERT